MIPEQPMKYFFSLIIVTLVSLSFAGEPNSAVYVVINYVKTSNEYRTPVSAWPTETKTLVPKYSILSGSPISTLKEFGGFLSTRPLALKTKQPVLQMMELDNWLLCEIPSSFPSKGSWSGAYAVEKNTRKVYFYWSW